MMMEYSAWLNQQENVMKEQPSQWPQMEQVSPSVQRPYLPLQRYQSPLAQRPDPEDVFVTPYEQLGGDLLDGVEGIVEPA